MATEEEKHEELREKYVELQLIAEQIKQLKQQAQMLEEQSIELTMTMQGLEDLEKTTQDKEILVPISTGIFTKAQLKAGQDLIVNVGGNILVKKDVKTTIEMTKDRIKTVEQYQQDTLQNLQILTTRANELDEELTKLTQELKKE